MNLTPIKANMTELELKENVFVLFSYKTPVAVYENGKHIVTEKYWSRTTSRHINQWLSGATPTTKPQEYFDNLVSSVGGK